MLEELVQYYDLYVKEYGSAWVETADFRKLCCHRMNVSEEQFNAWCMELMDSGQLRQRLFAGKFYINLK